MNYASYIDIPNWETISKKIVSFRQSELDADPDYKSKNKHIWWCYFHDEVKKEVPELIEKFESIGLTMKQMILFNNLPNDINVKDHNNPKSLFIHTDSEDDPESVHDLDLPVLTDFPPTCAINLPLLNCKGSYTLWYKKLNSNPDVFHVNPGCGGHAHQDVEEVHRFELDKPAVLRINVPHAVWNPSDTNRVVATFRFKESLEHLIK